jgi:hypothetical protein
MVLASAAVTVAIIAPTGHTLATHDPNLPKEADPATGWSSATGSW